MRQIEQRVKSVLSRRIGGFVFDKLAGDDLDRLEQAKRDEAEARMNALARAASQSAQSPASADAGTTPSAIQEMIDEEDCPVCTRVLEALAEMDEPQRTRGIAEYGEFRSAIERSEKAAIETLEDADVLPEAMKNLREVQL